MNLVVMRHGETDWNRCGRMQGQLETSLNQTGYEQIRNACRKLFQRYAFARILSSPLLRARQSAMVCGDYFQLPIEFVQQFSERRFGLLEGKTREEIYEQFQVSHPEEISDTRFGVESMDRLVERLVSGLEYLHAQYADETLLLLTHGSIIRCLAGLGGQNIDRIGNGGFFELDLGRIRKGYVRQLLGERDVLLHPGICKP
ncbi:histidine phosphatase family protein [Fodinisporobacter ferrooxydans]|uniref:Histidine phosphatase family protein n=1 Tax=Fodinisporobacter ferrooxydans TaxID=2901836 RepID=A0ABY4CH10_9BACL|nr:histidine phosphatase family protein [Alicyclobacillaceae bacterium MYW30-H2]